MADEQRESSERVAREAAAWAEEILVKAKARVAELDARYGVTLGELGVDFGAGEPTIKRRLSLLSTSDVTQAALAAGEVTATQAAAIAKMPHAEQTAAVAATKKINEERKESRAKKGGGGGGKKGKPEALPKAKAPARLKVALVSNSVASKEARAGMLYAIGEMSEEDAKEIIRGWPKAKE